MTGTFAGTVLQIERLKNSVNGNPAWRFTFTSGAVLDTAKDTAMAYEVSTSWEGQSFTVTTERGRIINMVRVL